MAEWAPRPLAGWQVSPLGFACIHLVGENGFGPAADPDAAIAALRRAVESGITYIDTADVLGPGLGELAIAEALHPYPSNVVISTKVGMSRSPDGGWHLDGNPATLRARAQASAERLRIERIPLLYLHRPDPAYPLADQLGVLAELQDEGLVDQLGVSAVTAEQLDEASSITPIAAVQNHFVPESSAFWQVVAATSQADIAFVCWSPRESRPELLTDPKVVARACALGVTPRQLVLASVLESAPHTIMLPGTSTDADIDEVLELLAAGTP